MSTVWDARNISMGCGPAFNSREFEVNSRIVIMRTYWSMTPSRRTCGFAILRSGLARGLRKVRVGGWKERTKAGLLRICGGVETAPRWKTAENREGAQSSISGPGYSRSERDKLLENQWVEGEGRQAVDARMDTFCQSPIRS